MLVEDDVDVLKVSSEAIRIRLTSEPYVVFTAFGYQAAIDIWHTKKKRTMRLLLSARTLSMQLEAIRNSNSMSQFKGIEFWICKETDERRSPYKLTE